MNFQTGIFNHQTIKTGNAGNTIQFTMGVYQAELFSDFYYITSKI